MRPNVLLVVLDTVRAKSCSHHGRARDTTTGISSLQSDSITFTRAIAPATWTVPSHAAMFTGKYPSELGVNPRNKVLPEGEETIASILSEQGYSTALLSSNPFLTEGTELYRGTNYRHTSGMRRTLFKDAFDPAKYVKQREHSHGLSKFTELAGELAAPPRRFIKNLLNAGYYKCRTTWKRNDTKSKYDPETDDGGKETIAKFLDWVDTAELPFYTCLNFMEPHTPFRHRTDYLPEWADITDLQELIQDRDAYFTGTAEFDQQTIELLVALYEAEIRYIDQQLKMLWSSLQERGLWEDTLIIITSDHGEYLGEHELIFHHHNRLSDPLIHVPLLVKHPRARHGGTSVSTPVDLTQIYDTIMHTTGNSAGGEAPLNPDTDPRFVKSEYICKEPTHSTAEYLDKYNEINTPSRAVFDNGVKYLLFENKNCAYIGDHPEDDGPLDDLNQIPFDEVPDEVLEFAEFGAEFGNGEALEISETVEGRLEELGYK